MSSAYPALKDTIYCAKIHTDSGLHVRIRDTVTGKDFKANPATVRLLELCTGTQSVDDIVNVLSQQSGEPREDVYESVNAMLNTLQEKGAVTIRSTPSIRDSPPVKDVKVRYPVESAHIDITNRCNLSCLHCVNDSGECYPDELTTDEIKSLIDTLSCMGVDIITFSGGEPLMRPDFFEIVKYARKAPMTVYIFTNGTLITEDIIKRLKKACVSRFYVSIDSVTEHIHDTFRGQKGALKRTLASIHLMKEAQFQVIPCVSVNQMNKNDIVHVLQYFKEQNLKDFQLMPVRFSGRGIQGISLTPEEYYVILVEQFTYLKEEFPEGIVTLYRREKVKCGIASDSIAIKADGTILPCPGCISDMGVGNIREVSLEELWDTDTTLELIRKMRMEDDKECNQCQYHSYCGGCMAGAFILERGFRWCDPYVCALLRAYNDVVGWHSQ